MAIRINTNIFSLFVNRNLVRTGQRLDDSYQKLSSGEKINRAGDDPAGLANSNALRAKIAGLQRNLINGNQGVNLTNVAESALGNVSDILQRLRELSVQASTATVADSQRYLIQREADGLVAEIERIGTSANYNDKNLLDGSFRDLRLQVGTRAGQSIPVSIADMRTTVLGSIAQAVGALPVDNLPIAGNGDLTINGQTVPATQTDGISGVENTVSAIAKANAINSITYLTGVSAKAEASSASGASSIGAGSLDGAASSLIINGTNIGPIDFLDRDSSGVLREKINGFTTLTGVTASLGINNELVLTASDGRNLEITATGTAAPALGLPNGTTLSRGSITLSSQNTIQVGGQTGRVGFAPGQTTIYVDSSTALKYLSLTTQDSAEQMLERIDSAIKQVLAARADLGALQSRLDQTINDISINIENLTGADSRIRDTDFAFETSRMTQAQIIQQAGVAILAQANIIPQMALNLLQK